MDDAVPGSEEVLGDPGRGPRRRWPGWLAVLLAGAVAAIVVEAVTHRSKPVASPETPIPTRSSSPTSASGPASVVSPPPIRVTDLGHPLLGAAGWELFGRGVGVVVRIQPELGRITRTFVPGLASSGPVSFIAAAHEVIIRPLDLVPGYAVPDGQPARELSAGLSHGGPALPGPDPRHVWVLAVDRSVMVLVGLDGKQTGSPIGVPADMNSFPATDDAGGLLLTGTGGAYDAQAAGLHRITTGTLLGLGPTRWLTRECKSRHQCATVVINRTDGDRHTLRNLPRYARAGASPGVISPDGGTAALVDPATARVHLIDMTSGADHPLAVAYSRAATPGETMVWSPDSRWLFVADPNGRLAVIDARTRQQRHLGAPLPQLIQLAIRDAPR